MIDAKNSYTFFYIAIKFDEKTNNCEIPVNSMKTIFKSKQELHNWFQQDAGCYLPKLNKTPIQFLREVLAGRKGLLKKKDIDSVGTIPRLEEFNLKSLWQVVKNRKDFMHFFPNIPEGSKTLPDRDYLLNVLNTIENKCITKMFAEARKRREELEIKEKMEAENLVEVNANWVDALMATERTAKMKGRTMEMIQKKAKKIRKPRQKKFTSKISNDLKSLDFKVI